MIVYFIELSPQLPLSSLNAKFRKLTETPHVDWCSIGKTKNDFGWPIETWLDVRVNFAVWIARAAEINDFDWTAATLLQQNIFL